MHREFQPAWMGGGPHHHQDHDSPGVEPQASPRGLIAVTAVVGTMLAGHLAWQAWGGRATGPWGFSLALAAAIVGGGRIVYLAIAALLEGRIGADIALAIASVAAALLGEYFVAAEVVFIALVGECLEAYTFERARGAIAGLFDFRPSMARVVRDGVEQEIAAESVRVGDRVRVRPGERLPVDGRIVSGRSAIDQAVLTGEGMPVDKGPGDPVFQGTLNQFGRLEIEAQGVGESTTLGQVIRLLDEAQRRKSPPERAADRYARLFLPALLITAALVGLFTNAGTLIGWARSGTLPRPIDPMPALAVLVVACPCALVLATPAAVMAATARLARRGVLVKGGAALETLARADLLAFDKTGTLTIGRPELADVIASPGWDSDGLIRLAAAAERHSEHPLARLIVEKAGELGGDLPEAGDFRAHPGAGITARVGGRELLVGNPRLIREHGIAPTAEVEEALKRLDRDGQTVLIVAQDGRVAGLIGARDAVRPEAFGVIHELKLLGLTDLAILTGDRPAAAETVAKRVQIHRVEAELTPEGKADWIRARQAEGRSVAMIGDGINDAPALALADAGIALAGVGTDIAAEAGSILLMGEPIAPLPGAIRMARQTMKVIRQNIVIFAFGLNGLAIVLAGLRVLGPVGAAIFHQVGSLLVLLNALRLLAYDPDGPGAVPRFVAACRRLSPPNPADWASRHRGRLASIAVGLGLVAWILSGIAIIGPNEVGVLRHWGRLETAWLEPGLHWRWPPPIEQVSRVEPDRIRVARVGLPSPSASNSGNPVAWNAAHGGGRDESALFFTGDENLVELSAVVEYRWTRDGLANALFGASDVEKAVGLAAEAALRESSGRSSLEAILVERRGPFEEAVTASIRERLAGAGLSLKVDRVRVLDAHPPREVVPSYRDVSAAQADAERYRNAAEAFAAERISAAKAEAAERLDGAEARSNQLARKAEGEHDAFLDRRRARSGQSALTDFRLLSDAWAGSLAGRDKLILDPRAAGRRQIWLADPERFNLPMPAAAPPPTPDD